MVLVLETHGSGSTKLGGGTTSITFIAPASDMIVVRVLQCPQCGSSDLYYEAGLITGQKYHCKNCGYIGAFVIEREVPER